VRHEVFADALRVSPRISEVAVHDGAVTLTGQLESGAAPPSRGSDAPAGRCRRRRGRPHPPLRRQAHTGHRTDRAQNGRRPAARVMSPRPHPLSAALIAVTTARGLRPQGHPIGHTLLDHRRHPAVIPPPDCPRSTTNAGRSSRPSPPCVTRCGPDCCRAPRTRPVSSRSFEHTWPPIRMCLGP
jgi:hypothetical protein